MTDIKLIDGNGLIKELERGYAAHLWASDEVHFSLADMKWNIETAPTIKYETIRDVTLEGLPTFKQCKINEKEIPLEPLAWVDTIVNAEGQEFSVCDCERVRCPKCENGIEIKSIRHYCPWCGQRLVPYSEVMTSGRLKF